MRERKFFDRPESSKRQDRSLLTSHLKIVHENKKHHKCDSCGKSFSVAGDLKRHINAVHDGQKDQKCDSCGISFSQSWYLKKHYLQLNVVKYQKVWDLSFEDLILDS